MTGFAPVRWFLAALVVALGYGWVFVLCVMAAVLGIAMAAILPVFIVAVPVILRATHETAESVIRSRPATVTLRAERAPQIAPAALAR